MEKTYTNCITCKIDGVEYVAGTYVMTDGEFNTYKRSDHTYTDADNQPVKDADDREADDDYIFRESNNVSHDKGYILTYEVNNPSQWDNWYTPKSNTTEGGKITLAEYEVKDAAGKALYTDGPTYHLNTSEGAVLGQSEYKHGDLIPEAIYTTYENTVKSHIPAGEKDKQATFEKAYIVKNKITIEGATSDTYYNPGTAVPETFALAHLADCEEAYFCTKTIEVTKDDIIYKDSKMKKSDALSYVSDVKGRMNVEEAGTSEMTVSAIKSSGYSDEKKKKLIALATVRDDLQTNLVQAYYCTSKDPSEDGYDGPYNYGGNYYESGKNYRGLEAWSSMSDNDRRKFDFNYDALDLFIDPSYSKDGGQSEGQKYQYDSAAGTSEYAVANKAHYSLETSVDYTAEYNDTESPTLSKSVTVKHSNGTSESVDKLIKGDELSRDEFEKKLINEQRYYSTIAVKEAGTYYVVNTPFQIGSTPYAVGETISGETYTSLSPTEQEFVTSFEFTESEKNTNFYYCREPYTIETEHKVKSIKGENTHEYNEGETVPVGTVISATSGDGITGYSDLTNEQRNFTIHGISPTETSTLYVSRESNIYDLSKEKIITVIYQYDYDETDASGNVTPVSERHVVNIHLSFKSGVPVVEDITPPEIILPGDLITMREPTVTPGAYEVTGGGWELFATQRDAESHMNGVEYNPNFDKLYWYQDEYYVAYYAKSYLGRTYSNAVPVSVANYHDMADVMSDEYKTHHMYIDHKNVKRYPKIYINDYSASGKNGLDIFKQLFDLSLLHTGEPDDAYKVITDENGIITTGDFAGHHTIDDHVKGGKRLEFFMHTDINHPDPWTSIGTDAQCFEGTLHGDGHTISGLDHSLFNNLCGEVYNLGVTGSFNEAGVVNKGSGYVESAWVKTTNATALDPKPYAVFGAPSDANGYQTVNSYFLDDNKDLYNTTTAGDVTTSGGARGKATAKSAKAYYNGELAYDLNNFYLYKRYNDRATTSGPEKEKYSYFTIGDDDKLVLQNDHYYSAHAELCSSGYEDKDHNVIMYVEDRFADGDFRYAAGVIPESEDERYYTWKVIDPVTEKEKEESAFFPIWPDDYIFFGQKLTYGWAAEAHQDVPTAVARDEGRLSKLDDANRVYRAPAYFRSKQMGVAHFNPAAYLAQNSFDGTKEAYPGMTAIDFNGHQEGHATSAYKLGLQDGWFYSPLLDDDGLTGIRNCDETQNLLVYAPAAAGDGYVNSQTHGVLTAYFVDPVYNTHYSYSGGYRLVSENVDNINGHLVQSDLTATNDHLLVDKQDFNAPRAYTFDAGHLMWYQRKPGLKEYVDLTSGWQGISLPFTAELVTTDTKGEITHFYSGSETSKNGTGTKIGHEYWLRELTDGSTMTKKSEGILEANFHYPAAAGATKTVGNTFLWDYYYQNTDRKDANDDTYQKYYSSSRSYSAYPLLTAGTPYILGLPGQTYYEFDLSGKFEAQHTALPAPPILPKQVITFASDKGIAIGVSDDEMAGKKITYGGREYTFKPSYMNETLKTNINYVMNSDGDAYVKLNDAAVTWNTTSEVHTFADDAALTSWMTDNYKLYTDADGVTEATTASGSEVTYYKRTTVKTTQNDVNHVTSSLSAFRPYFTTIIPSTGSTKMSPANEIVFTGDYDDLIDEEPISVDDGTLEIYTREHNVVTTSHLKNPVTVTVVSVAGITYAHYVLQPGETVETPVRPGVYIVNRKKLLVKPGHRRFN